MALKGNLFFIKFTPPPFLSSPLPLLSYLDSPVTPLSLKGVSLVENIPHKTTVFHVFFLWFYVCDIVVEMVTLFLLTMILDTHVIPLTVIGGSWLLLVDHKVILVKDPLGSFFHFSDLFCYI